MTQMVSDCLHTMEVQVQSQASPCGICDGLVIMGQVSLSVQVPWLCLVSVLPLLLHTHSFIHPLMLQNLSNWHN